MAVATLPCCFTVRPLAGVALQESAYCGTIRSNPMRTKRKPRGKRNDHGESRVVYVGGASPRTYVPLSQIPRDFFPPVPARAVSPPVQDCCRS